MIIYFFPVAKKHVYMIKYFDLIIQTFWISNIFNYNIQNFPTQTNKHP